MDHECVGSSPIRGWVRSAIFVNEVRKGSKFSFSEFGPVFSIFLAKQVQSMGFLEGFEII